MIVDYCGEYPRNVAEALEALRLSLSIDDSPFCQIVGRQFDSDLITRNDADKVLSHSPCNMGHDFGSSLQLDTKPGIGQSLCNGAFDFESVFFLSQNGSLIIAC